MEGRRYVGLMSRSLGGVKHVDTWTEDVEEG